MRPAPTDDTAAGTGGDGSGPSPTRPAGVTARLVVGELGLALVAVVVTGIAIWLVLDLGGLVPRRPISLNGDAIWYAHHVKGFLADTNHWVNPDLGVPFGQDMTDFPLGGNNLNWAVIRVIGWIDDDWALVYNAFYLATYGLVAAVATLVLRRWGLGPSLAVALAVLYATAPYHFLRGHFHVFLSAYELVPVGVHLALRQLGPRPYLWPPDGSLRLLVRRPRTWLVVAAGLAVGSAGPYYALWSAMFVGAAGVLAWARGRDVRHLGSALIVAGLIVGALMVNLAPNVIARVSGDVNPVAIQRSPAEADIYGLRIVDLVLPIGPHRLAPLRDALADFARTPVPSEGSDHLGLVAAAGLVGLVTLALAAAGGRRLPPGSRLQLAAATGALCLLAMITASIGGLSWLVRLVLPQLRAWNRISIFLSFLGLLAVGWGLERLLTRIGRGRRRTGAALGVSALLVVLGVADQSSPSYVPAYRDGADAMNRELAFWGPVEDDLGPGADVFQFPVVPFPENPRIVDQGFYEHLLPYLATEHLRFSSGGMKGREADWQLVLDRDEPDVLVGLLVDGGFEAVQVDRWGYTDRGAAIEAVLSAAVGPPRWESPDGRQAVYDLRRLTGGPTDPDEAFLTGAALTAAMQPRYEGSWGLERIEDEYARWLRPTARVEIPSPDGRSHRVEFHAELSMLAAGEVRISDAATGLPVAQIGVDEPREQMSLPLVVPPGGLTLVFEADSPVTSAPGDSRTLGVLLRGPHVITGELLREALD